MLSICGGSNHPSSQPLKPNHPNHLSNHPANRFNLRDDVVSSDVVSGGTDNTQQQQHGMLLTDVIITPPFRGDNIC
jgi:hypothetical protein